MKTCSFPVAGSCPLKDLYLVIRYQETFFWRLSDIQIDERLNIVSFHEAPNVPPDFELRSTAKVAPKDKTEQWRGKAIFNGQTQEVVLYREP